MEYIIFFREKLKIDNIFLDLYGNFLCFFLKILVINSILISCLFCCRLVVYILGCSYFVQSVSGLTNIYYPCRVTWYLLLSPHLQFINGARERSPQWRMSETFLLMNEYNVLFVKYLRTVFFKSRMELKSICNICTSLISDHYFSFYIGYLDDYWKLFSSSHRRVLCIYLFMSEAPSKYKLWYHA